VNLTGNCSVGNVFCYETTMQQRHLKTIYYTKT
jgi:hypothetical protein